MSFRSKQKTPERKSTRLERKRDKQEQLKKQQDDAISELRAVAEVKRLAQAALNAKGGILPTKMSSGSNVDKEFSTNLCFDSIKSYIKKKQPKCPDDKLIDELINIMNNKGFTISKENFDNLYTQICNWSRISDSTKSVNAKEFFKLLKHWFTPSHIENAHLQTYICKNI